MQRPREGSVGGAAAVVVGLRRMPTARRVLAGRTVLAACCVLAAGHAAAQPAIPAGVAALEQSVVDIVARAERSVVSISHSKKRPDTGLTANQQRAAEIFIQNRRAGGDPLRSLQRLPGDPPLASGAGVVIDADGLILTQYLVVDPAEDHTVTDVEGRRYSATILAADPRSGLAVLKVDAENQAPGAALGEQSDLPALPIGEAERLRKGRFVVVIGNPYAIESDGQPTIGWGIVANTARKAPVGEDLNGVPSSDGSFRTTLHHLGSMIQTDARLGWNASGGALVTLDGRLVGITTSASMIAGHESPAGYAIPLNEAMRRAVERLSDGREPEYGLLGVSFEQQQVLNPQTGSVGIGVGAVYRGSPAGRAGLAAGDLIVRVARRPTPDADALRLAVGSLPPGTDAELLVERGEEEREVVVKLGKAYVEGRRVVTNRPPAWRGLRVDYPTAVPGAVLRERATGGHIDPAGCVVVSEVVPGSVSAQSGVTPYSYISHVGGQRVGTPDEFYAAVRSAADNVKLKFTKPLPAVPAAAPPQAGGPIELEGLLPGGGDVAPLVP